MIIILTPGPYYALQNSHGYAKAFIRKFMDYMGKRPQKVSQPSLTISRGIPRHGVSHMFCLLRALCIKSIKEHVMGRLGSSPLICSRNLQNSAK